MCRYGRDVQVGFSYLVAEEEVIVGEFIHVCMYIASYYVYEYRNFLSAALKMSL